MSDYFYRGQFNKYEISSELTNSLKRINESTEKYEFFSEKDGLMIPKTTVFLSHKHDDLDFKEVQHIIKFLESRYNVKVYIDSRDPNMPLTTNKKTAQRIKEKIINSDKFIFLATNNAIQSMWCNWEVGFGDFAKLDENNLAIFPMLDDKTDLKGYKGNEYLNLYPSIVFENGTQLYSDGSRINKGYYIKKKDNGSIIYTRLKDWFNEQ